MNIKIIIGVVALLVIGAVVYYFFVLQKSDSQITPLEQTQGFGSDLYGNPGEVIPETNPFQNVQANPLGGTNPFEGGYQNPFGE